MTVIAYSGYLINCTVTTLVSYEEEDIRRALDLVNTQASEHASNYAAGMREARRIMESELMSDRIND
jgi:hypothetical protein